MKSILVSRFISKIIYMAFMLISLSACMFAPEGTVEVTGGEDGKGGTVSNSPPKVTIEQAINESVSSCSFVTTSDPAPDPGFVYRVSFNKPIQASTFTTSDIINSGSGGGTTLDWLIVNCGDDQNFKLVATNIIGDGTIIPSIPAGAVADNLNLVNSASTSEDNIVTFDNTDPTVTLNIAATETVGTCSFTARTSPTNTLDFQYRITFSEAINTATFDLNDITNTGSGGSGSLTWELTNCGDDANFMLTVKAMSNNGPIIPEIAANAVTDIAGNFNSVFTTTDNIMAYDNLLPTVTINQAVAETAGSCTFTQANDPAYFVGFEYRVKFSEVIDATTFTTADISNAGTGGGSGLTWTLTNCGDNSNFKLVATSVSGDGTIIPELSAGSVLDPAGNAITGYTTTDNSVTFDSVGVYPIINQAVSETVGSCTFTAASDPINTTGFEYKLSFNKPINTGTFDATDIVNTGTGGATTLVWAITNCGDDTNFKLTAASVVGVGTIIPTMLANAVQDPFANNSVASTSTDNSIYFDDQSPNVTIEEAITEIVSSCNFLGVTDPSKFTGFSFRVQFDEAIETASFDSSDIVNIGTGGGSGLTWSITNCGDNANFMITATSITGDGTIIPTINPATVTDPYGNANTASTSTDNSVTYDSTNPNVTIEQAITETVGSCNFTATNDPTNSTGFTFKISFNESINISTLDVSDITNIGSGGSSGLIWSLNSCGDNQNFMLTATSITGDGVIQPTMNAARVIDLAGNNNNSSTSTDNQMTYDTTGLSVTVNQSINETVGSCTFTNQLDPTNVDSMVFRIEFSKVFDAATFDETDISQSGTGGTSYTYTLTDCGDGTNFKLDVTSIVGLGTIIPEIAAGNVADLTGALNSASTTSDNSVDYDTDGADFQILAHDGSDRGTCTGYTVQSDPSKSENINFVVSFYEPINITTFTTQDVSNSGTAGATAIAWNITSCGDSRNFILSTTTVTGDGTVIPVLDTANIQDLPGNNIDVETSVDKTVTLDTVIPNVTIEQHPGGVVGACGDPGVQIDPTNGMIDFLVTFDDDIVPASFTSGDITNMGSGGIATLTWNISDCGDNRNFVISTTAITGNGTIIPTLLADAVVDSAGNGNTLSTSTDNTVTYDAATLAVTINNHDGVDVGTCTGISAQPTHDNDINLFYKVVFSKVINNATFTVADVTNSGTGGDNNAGTLTWSLQDCGDDQNFVLSTTALSGEGTIIPTISSGLVSDLAANTNSGSTTTNSTVTYDTVSPDVAINQHDGVNVGTCTGIASQSDPTNAMINYKVVFNEEVDASTFTSADIGNSGSGGGTTLSWSVTDCGDNLNFVISTTAITGDGTIVPTLAAATVTDLAGNDNNLSTTTDNIVTYDTADFTATINQHDGADVGTCTGIAVQDDPTNSTTVYFKVLFSSAINATTFTSGDIANDGTGGSITLNWAVANCGDDTNFVISTTGINGDGTIMPKLNAGAVEDPAGNGNTLSTVGDGSVTFDSTSPDVTINQHDGVDAGTCTGASVQSDPTASMINYRVIFSEAIDSATFTPADITNGGTGGGGTLTWSIQDCGDDTNFVLSTTAITGDGTIEPSLNAATISDLAGNPSNASTSTDNSVTFDSSTLAVAVNRWDGSNIGTCTGVAAQGNATNDQSINYKVTFNKAINAASFATSDINNTGTGGGTTLTWSLSNCGDDTNFLLSTTAVDGEGTIRPTIGAAAVEDPATNPNTASTTSGNIVNYDITKPDVAINQHPGGIVGSCADPGTQVDPANSMINYLVTFDEAIDEATFTTADINNSGTGGATTLTWNITSCGDNLNYLLATTAITGDGTIIPSVITASVSDLAGNTTTASTTSDNSVEYDLTPPDLTINQHDGVDVGTCTGISSQVEISNLQTIYYKVAFDEPINAATFTTADIGNDGTGGSTVLTWNITGCGDNQNFVINTTAITGEGTIEPVINAGNVEDIPGNTNTLSTSTDNTVTFDISGPSVTINQHDGVDAGTCTGISSQADPTNAMISYKVVFSEPINDSSFVVGDISNSGAGGSGTLTWNIQNCGDDTNYVISTTAITGEGSIIPELASATVQDISGNDNSLSTSTDGSVTYDTVSPDVTINQHDGVNVGTCTGIATQTDPTNTMIKYKVTFNEPINSSTFTSADLSNLGSGGGGALSWSIQNCGDSLNFVISTTTITGDGTITPQLSSGIIEDIAGNTNNTSTAIDNNVTYDTTAPDVTINQHDGTDVATCTGITAQADPTSSTAIYYMVTFDEIINPATFTTADISNAGTGGSSLTWNITSCGNNQNFVINTTAITGQGTIEPVINSGLVSDITNNTNTISTSTDNSVTFDTGNVSVTINQHDGVDVGTCTGISSQADPTNAMMNFKVVFSEVINNSTFDTTDITNAGDGGSGTLTWNIQNCGDDTKYIITTTAITGDGTIIPELASATVQDLAGNDNTASTATDATVTFDFTNPDVTINQHDGVDIGTCTGVGAQVEKTNGTLYYKVIFSEAVDAASFIAGDITNNGTGGSTALTWNVEDCGNNLNFVISTTSITGDGTIIPELTAGKVNDVAGNGNNLYTATDNTVTYDSTSPNVTVEQHPGGVIASCISQPIQGDPTNAMINYLVTFDEPIDPLSFTVGDISNNGTGGTSVLTWSLTNCTDDQNFLLSTTAITGDGTIVPEIAADAVLDIAGNGNAISTATDNSVLFDVVNADVAIELHNGINVGTCTGIASQDIATNSTTINYKVTFNEAIDNATFDTSDISNGGTGGSGTLSWSLQNCGDNQNYILATTAITGDGTIIPEISSSSVQDPAGNNNNTYSTTNGNTVTFDGTAPDVAIDQHPGGAIGSCPDPGVQDDPTGYMVRFHVQFSEQIDTASLTTSDISNGGTGGSSSISWRIDNCGDDTNFIFVTTDIDGYGTIVPSLAGSSVQDPAGNNNNASTATDNSVDYIEIGWQQQAYIKSPTSGSSDSFGYSVSIDGDTLVSGTYFEDSNATTITNASSGYPTDAFSSNSGAVFVYARTGDNWTPQAYIKADNNDFNDYFGQSISLSRDTLVVGAINEDSSQTIITTSSDSDNTNGQSGAAYVFERSGSTWSLSAYLKAVNNSVNDYFGTNVVVSGDTIAVGADGEDSNQTSITNGESVTIDDSLGGSGAIYIYRKDVSSWYQEAFVKASNAKGGYAYGEKFEIQGDTLVVGVRLEDSTQTVIFNGTTADTSSLAGDSGAAYIYHRSADGTWAQEAYVKSYNSDSGDNFGYSVTLDGERVAVGSTAESSNETTITNGTGTSTDNTSVESGAVYIYKRTGSSWEQEAYIKAANNGAGDHFGSNISLSGDTLAVAAVDEQSNSTSIILGTGTDSDDSYTSSGAVYMYHNDGTGWAQEAYIKAAASGDGDEFGFSLQLNGDTLVVGAPSEDGTQNIVMNGQSVDAADGVSNSGAVYVYKNIKRLFSPDNVIATELTDTQIDLSWGKNLGVKAEGVKLAYASGTTPPADCDSGTSSDEGLNFSKSITGLSAATTYSFRICTYDEFGQTNGNTFKFTTKSEAAPAEPSGLNAVAADANTIDLDWTAGGGTTASYRVAYVEGTTAPVDCHAGTSLDVGNVVTYQVTGLTAATDYSFRVCAVNSDGTLSTGITAQETTP